MAPSEGPTGSGLFPTTLPGGLTALKALLGTGFTLGDDSLADPRSTTPWLTVMDPQDSVPTSVGPDSIVVWGQVKGHVKSLTINVKVKDLAGAGQFWKTLQADLTGTPVYRGEFSSHNIQQAAQEATRLASALWLGEAELQRLRARVVDGSHAVGGTSAMAYANVVRGMSLELGWARTGAHGVGGLSAISVRLAEHLGRLGEPASGSFPSHLSRFQQAVSETPIPMPLDAFKDLMAGARLQLLQTRSVPTYSSRAGSTGSRTVPVPGSNQEVAPELGNAYGQNWTVALILPGQPAIDALAPQTWQDLEAAARSSWTRDMTAVLSRLAGVINGLSDALHAVSRDIKAGAKGLVPGGLADLEDDSSSSTSGPDTPDLKVPDFPDLSGIFKGAGGSNDAGGADGPDLSGLDDLFNRAGADAPDLSGLTDLFNRAGADAPDLSGLTDLFTDPSSGSGAAGSFDDLFGPGGADSLSGGGLGGADSLSGGGPGVVVPTLPGLSSGAGASPLTRGGGVPLVSKGVSVPGVTKLRSSDLGGSGGFAVGGSKGIDDLSGVPATEVGPDSDGLGEVPAGIGGSGGASQGSPGFFPPLGGLGGMGAGAAAQKARERKTWLSEETEVWGVAQADADLVVLGRDTLPDESDQDVLGQPRLPGRGPRQTPELPVRRRGQGGGS